MVEFRDVSYGVGAREILRSVSFRVLRGQRLVLLGRSGSGKTTALRMVNAMVYPTAGEVIVEGRATSSWDAINLRRSAGYAIQDVGLMPHWSVARNIGLGLRLAQRPDSEIARRTDILLAEIGLEPEVYRERRPRALSGGQRQRVGVARALAAEPPLLLFDEPFGALDPVTRLELQQMLLRLCASAERTVLFVTHDLTEALTIGTHIALLHEGAVAWWGPAEEFRTAKHPEARAFLACLKS
jgi:osmoprotectant transport system ATP-binding protein